MDVRIFWWVWLYYITEGRLEAGRPVMEVLKFSRKKKKRLNEDHNCNMRKGEYRYNQDVELPGFGDSLNMTVKVKRII